MCHALRVIAEGERVTLHGRVRLLGEALVAPFSGELCVAHLSRARVFTALDHIGDHITDLEFFECAPFVLDAPEGSVLITERPSLVALEPEALAFVEPARILSFLRPRNLAAYGRSTFFEHVLVRNGDRVTMAGVVTRELAAGSESSFRELDVHTRLTGYGDYPLTLRPG